MPRYVVTLRCPDRPGIVHKMTGVMVQAGANILESAQFSDSDTDMFAMRSVFETDHVDLSTLDTGFDEVREEMGASIHLRNLEHRYRALVLVSKQDHCLLDILQRHADNELPIDIPLIVANHNDAAPIAERYGVPFEHISVTPATKPQAEDRLLALIDELEIDFVVLARYMQILSDKLCARLPGRIINIHHSFLPGFKGSSPYRQAHERGVKVIGATAHYVTADLDEGPIIEQDVERVSHSHSVDDLTRVGRDIERIVLARAVRYHAEDRVILVGSKTIVFT